MDYFDLNMNLAVHDGKRHVQWRVEDNVNDILNFIWYVVEVLSVWCAIIQRG